MHPGILAYQQALPADQQRVCARLTAVIDRALPDAESRIWHGHPVWFLDGNPIVGVSRLTDSIRLLFWSGQSFVTPGLQPEGKFQAADARFATADAIDVEVMAQWLAESRTVQWDYKNLVKRKGRLERLC